MTFRVRLEGGLLMSRLSVVERGNALMKTMNRQRASASFEEQRVERTLAATNMKPFGSMYAIGKKSELRACEARGQEAAARRRREWVTSVSTDGVSETGF
jgi:hypothetical protein